MGAMSVARAETGQALSEMQAKFVQHLVGEGCSGLSAARRAGYGSPKQEAYRLLRLPHIIAAVRDAQTRLIAVSGTNLALKTLCDVMKDPKAPASAKVSAAAKMMDAAGLFAAKNPGAAEKPLHEMTYAELEQLVQKANDEAAHRLNAPIPGVIAPQGGGEDEEDQEDS